MLPQLLVMVLSVLTYNYIVAPRDGFDGIEREVPTPPELVGPYAVNTELQNVEMVINNKWHGVEDVACKDGYLYASAYQNNTILRVDLKTGELSKVITYPGKPLGIAFDNNGDMIIADAELGVIKLDMETNMITLLFSEANGTPFAFTDYAVAAKDGMIYVTDASTKFNSEESALVLLEGQEAGRLVSYDPKTKETKVLADDLFFPNGIALSEEEDFLYLSHLGYRSIIKFYIKGPKAGTREPFAENLPGYPDNIHRSGRGTLWVGISNPVSSAEALYPYVIFKTMAANLIKLGLNIIRKEAIVAEIDEKTGKVIRMLWDQTGSKIYATSTAYEHEGYLYVGSFKGPGLVKYKL
mmetsp:Transcript_18419/g.20474  ORF Transcript_18419/g.20474 Transcript_18419/m.20474 type:complete len:354 (+) Transcript_18419:31-1092(+)